MNLITFWTSRQLKQKYNSSVFQLNPLQLHIQNSSYVLLKHVWIYKVTIGKGALGIATSLFEWQLQKIYVTRNSNQQTWRLVCCLLMQSFTFARCYKAVGTSTFCAVWIYHINLHYQSVNISIKLPLFIWRAINRPY